MIAGFRCPLIYSAQWADDGCPQPSLGVLIIFKVEEKEFRGTNRGKWPLGNWV